MSSRKPATVCSVEPKQEVTTSSRSLSPGNGGTEKTKDGEENRQVVGVVMKSVSLLMCPSSNHHQGSEPASWPVI